MSTQNPRQLAAAKAIVTERTPDTETFYFCKGWNSCEASIRTELGLPSDVDIVAVVTAMRNVLMRIPGTCGINDGGEPIGGLVEIANYALAPFQEKK
jgi:hypothetical protein